MEKKKKIVAPAIRRMSYESKSDEEVVQKAAIQTVAGSIIPSEEWKKVFHSKF